MVCNVAALPPPPLRKFEIIFALRRIGNGIPAGFAVAAFALVGLVVQTVAFTPAAFAALGQAECRDKDWRSTRTRSGDRGLSGDPIAVCLINIRDHSTNREDTYCVFGDRHDQRFYCEDVFGSDSAFPQRPSDESSPQYVFNCDKTGTSGMVPATINTIEAVRCCPAGLVATPANNGVCSRCPIAGEGVLADGSCGVCPVGHEVHDGFCIETAAVRASLVAEVVKPRGSASVAVVADLLGRPGGDPDATDSGGVPLLIVAATIGHAEIVRALVAAGADVNAVDPVFGGPGLTLDVAQHLATPLTDPAAGPRSLRASVLYRFGDALGARNADFDWNRENGNGDRALDILALAEDESPRPAGENVSVIYEMADYMLARGAACGSTEDKARRRVCVGACTSGQEFADGLCVACPAGQLALNGSCGVCPSGQAILGGECVVAGGELSAEARDYIRRLRVWAEFDIPEPYNAMETAIRERFAGNPNYYSFVSAHDTGGASYHADTYNRLVREANRSYGDGTFSQDNDNELAKILTFVPFGAPEAGSCQSAGWTFSLDGAGSCGVPLTLSGGAVYNQCHLSGSASPQCSDVFGATVNYFPAPVTSSAGATLRFVYNCDPNDENGLIPATTNTIGATECVCAATGQEIFGGVCVTACTAAETRVGGVCVASAVVDTCASAGWALSVEDGSCGVKVTLAGGEDSGECYFSGSVWPQCADVFGSTLHYFPAPVVSGGAISPFVYNCDPTGEKNQIPATANTIGATECACAAGHEFFGGACIAACAAAETRVGGICVPNVIAAGAQNCLDAGRDFSADDGGSCAVAVTLSGGTLYSKCHFSDESAPQCGDVFGAGLEFPAASVDGPFIYNCDSGGVTGLIPATINTVGALECACPAGEELFRGECVVPPHEELIAAVQEVSPNLSAIRALLDQGARADITLAGGLPLIFAAVTLSHAEVISVLITAGAHPETRHDFVNTPGFPLFTSVPEKILQFAFRDAEETAQMMIHFAEAVKVAAATSTVAFQWDDAARFENGLFSFAQESYARAAAAKREELSFVGGYLLEQGAECALTPAADGYAELCLSRRSCALSASSVTVVHSCGVCAGNPLRSGEGDSCVSACGGGQFAGEAASWGERQCQCADGEGLVGGSCVLSTVAAEARLCAGAGWSVSPDGGGACGTPVTVSGEGGSPRCHLTDSDSPQCSAVFGATINYFPAPVTSAIGATLSFVYDCDPEDKNGLVPATVNTVGATTCVCANAEQSVRGGVCQCPVGEGLLANGTCGNCPVSGEGFRSDGTCGVCPVGEDIIGGFCLPGVVMGQCEDAGWSFSADGGGSCGVLLTLADGAVSDRCYLSGVAEPQCEAVFGGTVNYFPSPTLAADGATLRFVYDCDPDGENGLIPATANTILATECACAAAGEEVIGGFCVASAVVDKCESAGWALSAAEGSCGILLTLADGSAADECYFSGSTSPQCEAVFGGTVNYFPAPTLAADGATLRFVYNCDPDGERGGMIPARANTIAATECGCESETSRLRPGACVPEEGDFGLSDALLCGAFGGTVQAATGVGGSGGEVCSGMDANDTFCIINAEEVNGVRAFPCRGLFKHLRSCNLEFNRPALNPFFCGARCIGEMEAVGSGCR